MERDIPNSQLKFLGDVYINGRPYRQLCFTPNQVALAIEDFLNGEDYDDGEEEHNMKNKEQFYIFL